MLSNQDKKTFDFFNKRPIFTTIVSFVLIVGICLSFQLLQHDVAFTFSMITLFICMIVLMWLIWVLIAVNLSTTLDYINAHPVLHAIFSGLAIISIYLTPSLSFIRRYISQHTLLFVILAVAYLGILVGYLHQIKTGKNAFEAIASKAEKYNTFLYVLLILGTFTWAGLYIAGLTFIIAVDLIGFVQFIYSGIGNFF